MKEFGDFVTPHFEKLQAKILACQTDWLLLPQFPKDASSEQQRDFALSQLFDLLSENHRTDRILERVIFWYLRDGLISVSKP